MFDVAQPQASVRRKQKKATCTVNTIDLNRRGCVQRCRRHMDALSAR